MDRSMQKSISILIPYRNRDETRIRLVLESLEQQTNKDFNVVLVDYGSSETISLKIESLINSFDFTSYHYVAHPGLLWNKSKALNFGIRNTNTDYIVTTDTDVLFTPDFIDEALKLRSENSFSLFKIGYLSKQESLKQYELLNVKDSKAMFFGDTFGIGLFPKKLLEAIGGLDEFFHFYGSEDEDLNARLQLIGATLNKCEKQMLYHLWHPRYPRKKDHKLTSNPRLTNILRINQYHFLQNRANKISFPNDKNWGNCFRKSDNLVLSEPHQRIKLKNIAAHVVHFFEEELPKYNNDTIEVIIEEDNYYNSIKYKIKNLMGKQSQPYLSMKAVNDLILKNILFRYRDYNYCYEVSLKLKQISFILDFKSKDQIRFNE